MSSSVKGLDEYFCVCVAVSLVACQEREAEELMSRKDHEEEMQRIRMELQQCKEFIHVQQQLLQVNNTSNNNKSA